MPAFFYAFQEKLNYCIKKHKNIVVDIALFRF